MYLDIPVKVSQDLMNKRYSGDTSRKDLHESNEKFLDLCVQASRWAAGKDNWVVVGCMDGERLKSIDEIHKDVVEAIEHSSIFR